MMDSIKVDPKNNMLHGGDREWLDTIEQYGVPTDSATMEHAAKMLVVLWREYKWLEDAIEKGLM